GQMSFWAATVITNLFSAIPLVGESIVTWLWGGYSVGNPTLNRFYSLHYLLPFVIAGVVVLHIWALHMVGQNNPTGIEPKTERDTVAFTPYATIKDGFFMVVFCILFAWFVFYIPNFLGQPGGDPDAHRSGMVLPAVLRHPARDPEQASRRDGARCVDRHPGLLALARYLESQVGALSPALPAVLLGVRHRLHRSGLARLQAAGGQLCPLCAHLHRLLLRLFPRDPAGAGQGREDQATAEFDRGLGVAGRQADRGARSASTARQGLRPHHGHCAHSRYRRCARRADRTRAGAGARHPEPADEQVVVLGTVRQIRSRAAPARVQGLPRSLPGLSRPEAGGVPYAGGAGRTRFHDPAG